MISPFGSPETTYLGSAFVVLGYLLAVHGWTFLLAGYGDDTDVPADVVAETVGRFALLVGVATIGFGALVTRNSYGFGWQGIAFGAIVLLATVGLTYRLHTDEPAETTTEPSESVDLSTSPVDAESPVPDGRVAGHSIDVQRSVPEVSSRVVDSPAERPVQLSTSSVGQGVHAPREISQSPDQQADEHAHQSVDGLTEASD